MENKKVLNARECTYNGIKFRSDLEKKSYIALLEAGFNPQYEVKSFHVWKGDRFNVPCYDLHNDRKLKKTIWGLNSYKPQDIKYTPDFTFYIKDAYGKEIFVVIEAKGYPNDRYAYVKKLFRGYLEENIPNSMFFEIHTQKQLKSTIEIIKTISQ